MKMEIIQGGPALIRCVLLKGLRSETGVRNMLLFSATNKHLQCGKRRGCWPGTIGSLCELRAVCWPPAGRKTYLSPTATRK